MAFWDKNALNELSQKQTIHLINSITGIKPGNLISTRDSNGAHNVAVFSSVVHLGSAPPLLGFVLRPKGAVTRHTYDNILETGLYNINAIHQDWADKAHSTSLKFAKTESEFEAVGLPAQFREGNPVPFVEGAPIQIGMKHLQSIDIELNGTTLVIGEVQSVFVPDQGVDEEGRLDLETLQVAGVSGLNGYYSFKHLAEFSQPEMDSPLVNLLKAES